MSKPEYGTIEYIRAHQQEWWTDEDGGRYFLIGLNPNGRVTWCHEDFTNSAEDWYANNTRPESDPAPVKRKVECKGLWVLYDHDGNVVDYYMKEDDVKKNELLYTVIRHIPATTIEVEA